MNILLTNDDGIYAPGIFAVHKELSKIANVTVVAPDSERSSTGHAITLAHPLRSQEVSFRNKFFGYALSGTPSDCVKFGLDVICSKKPDVVVSGINLGSNDGCSVFYSGTVAGAREGALCGIPSVALSLCTFTEPDFSYAARFSTKLISKVVSSNMPKGTFLNVNIPNLNKEKIKGVCVTKQSLVPIHGVFKQKTDPFNRDYYWLTGKLPVNEKNKETDSNALSQNYITIVPTQVDTTDYDFLKRIQDWKII